MSATTIGVRQAIKRLIVAKVAVLSLAHRKKAWLCSIQTWGDVGLAASQVHVTLSEVALWRTEDDEFDSSCRKLEKSIEDQVLVVANQRAIRGDAVTARVLASRRIQAGRSTKASQNRAEIDIEPPAPRPPVTQEQAAAHIRALLEARGVEIPLPGELSRPVYSEEQWAKWGR